MDIDGIMSDWKKFLRTWVLPPGVVHKLIDLKGCARLYKGGRAGDKALLAANEVLQNSQAGRRCFILGAGSSVQQQDIRKLKDDIVISVSNTFVHPDYSHIQPAYHVVPHLRFGHGGLMSDSEFVSWLRQMETATLQAEMFFHIQDRDLIEDNDLFNDRIIHWVEYCSWSGDMNLPINLSKVPHVWSVSELAITIAVYMGFDKIYLLGIDHDWFNGPLVYFYDHTKQHSLRPTEAQLTSHGVDAEFQMRRHADIFKKYKYLYSIRQNIFNANSNPSHYLDVFPKVDFDSLFPAGKEGGSCAG